MESGSKVKIYVSVNQRFDCERLSYRRFTFQFLFLCNKNMKNFLLSETIMIFQVWLQQKDTRVSEKVIRCPRSSIVWSRVSHAWTKQWGRSLLDSYVCMYIVDPPRRNTSETWDANKSTCNNGDSQSQPIHHVSMKCSTRTTKITLASACQSQIKKYKSSLKCWAKRSKTNI